MRNVTTLCNVSEDVIFDDNVVKLYNQKSKRFQFFLNYVQSVPMPPKVNIHNDNLVIM